MPSPRGKVPTSSCGGRRMRVDRVTASSVRQLTDKLQFACHQTSNPAYFSTSSEKMEFAQANHSRLNSYSLLALMLSCMK